MSNLKELLHLLEERLDEHDNSRKEVQNKLHEVCAEIVKDAGTLEEKIAEKIGKDYEEREEMIFDLIGKFTDGRGKVGILTKQAMKILSKEWAYEIRRSESAESFADSYELVITSVDVEEEPHFDGANKTELIAAQLEEHLAKLSESADAARAKISEVCNEKRTEAEALEKRINGELEGLFGAEDTRLQKVVKEVKEKLESEDPEEVEELAKRAKQALLVSQRYSILGGKGGSLGGYDLKVEKEASLKFVGFEEIKPSNLTASFTENGELSLSLTLFSGEEASILKGANLGQGLRGRCGRGAVKRAPQGPSRAGTPSGAMSLLVSVADSPRTRHTA